MTLPTPAELLQLRFHRKEQKTTNKQSAGAFKVQQPLINRRFCVNKGQSTFPQSAYGQKFIDYFPVVLRQIREAMNTQHLVVY